MKQDTEIGRTDTKRYEAARQRDRYRQTDRQTDRQPHTHTDRQTTRYFPTWTITIHSVNEMTECKNTLKIFWSLISYSKTFCVNFLSGTIGYTSTGKIIPRVSIICPKKRTKEKVPLVIGIQYDCLQTFCRPSSHIKVSVILYLTMHIQVQSK